MPSIHKLQISAFRNINQESLEPAPGLNLIAGENGSGKSSILEAVYLLGLGRSFRSTRQTPLIQHGQRSCSAFCELDSGITLGTSRSLDDSPLLKVQGQKVSTSAELAKHLPLQLLNADIFRLLEGGPKTRRQFIDWGVFHVEHQFHQHWRDFKHCLQSRNILLKKKAPAGQLDPWSQELVRHAIEIDKYRRAYLEMFLSYLENMLERLITLEGLTFRYYRGWKDDESLEQALAGTLERDLALGHTAAGPQRADLKIKIGSQYASNVLSRGQQKLLVSVMKLAQGAYLAEESGHQCIYLIDDLPAELDRSNRQKVCNLLHDLGGQVFITGTEESELKETLVHSGFRAGESKLFHVKHGRIESLNPEAE